MANLTGANWRKSTRSGNGGNCVEVATNLLDSAGVVAVRDSKDPDGPVLTFTPEQWQAFITAAQQYEFGL